VRDWNRSLKRSEKRFGAAMVVMEVEVVMHINIDIGEERSRWTSWNVPTRESATGRNNVKDGRVRPDQILRSSMAYARIVPW
jgi:hypothetical protein